MRAIRLTTLEAAVAALSEECLALRAQLRERESEIDSLRDEVDETERRIAEKQRAHQRTVDRYEELLAEKDRAYRDCRSELEAARTAGAGLAELLDRRLSNPFGDDSWP